MWLAERPTFFGKVPGHWLGSFFLHNCVVKSTEEVGRPRGANKTELGFMRIDLQYQHVEGLFHLLLPLASPIIRALNPKA